jgi:hypothetical protein
MHAPHLDHRRHASVAGVRLLQPQHLQASAVLRQQGQQRVPNLQLHQLQVLQQGAACSHRGQAAVVKASHLQAAAAAC